MTSRAIKLLLPLLILCAAGLSPARAEDKVSKTADKAAAQLLNSMKDYLTDMGDVQSMKPQEKIDYILKKAEDRVKKTTADTFKAEIQKRMEEYAEKTIRARAVKEIAIPQMLTHLSTGLTYDKARVDALVASQVDTQMRALKAGITGAKITYDVIAKTNSGGALEGFKALSATVYDKMAGYYIPGWSWFKIGVDLTEALGNYVLSYANETAKMAMYADMYPEAKASPSSFAEWLLKHSEREIGLDVARRWESEQVDFAPYLWEGKGTDYGAAQMRARLRDMLFKMRKEIDQNTKAQRATQALIEAEARAAYEESLAAQKALKDAAYKASKAADERLDKIAEFKQLFYGYQRSVDYADDGSSTGEATAEAVKSLSTYFTFNITLDDLKIQLRQIYFTTDWDKGESPQPDISSITDRLDAEWENVKKKYAAEKTSVEAYCYEVGHVEVVNASAIKSCQAYWNDTAVNQAKSESVYKGTQDLVYAYVRKLWDENSKNENLYISRINIATPVTHDYILENLERDLKNIAALPQSLNYVGFAKITFPQTTLLKADFNNNSSYHFQAYEDYLQKLRESRLEENQAMFKAEADLKDLLTRAADWEDYRQNVAEAKKGLEEAELEALQDEALTVASKKRLAELLEKIGKPMLRATALAGKSEDAEEALNKKKLLYATDLENAAKDNDLLNSLGATLRAAGKLIGELPVKYPRIWTPPYTSGAPSAPTAHFIFKVSPVPDCGRLLKENLIFDQGAVDKATKDLEARLENSGAVETDAVHGSELRSFALKSIAEYFSEVAAVSDSIFIPYGKNCVFFAKSFFDEETVKVAALPMKTWEDGQKMSFAIIKNLYKSMPYDVMGMWEGLDKVDTQKFLALTRGGHNAAAAKSIAAFCAAVDKKKLDYLEYLRKEKIADALDAEIEALSAEMTKAEGAANASQAAADWQNVAAFETRITALETKIASAEIYEERKTNFKPKLDNLVSKINLAKTWTSGKPGTGTPGQPSGPQGPQGPIGEKPKPPIDKPVPPADKPVPPADKPVPPADKPVPPADKPVPPADKPVPPADKPVPPADKPELPVSKPVDRPEPPVSKPVDKPEPPVSKPVDKPEPPVSKPVDRPEPPVSKPVDKPEPPVSKPADKPEPPVSKPVDRPEPPVSKPVDKPEPPVSKPVDRPELPVSKPVAKPNPPAKPVDDKPIGPEKPKIPFIPTTVDQNLEAIKTMYSDFKAAYEGKNESRVLKLISPDWDAGDGTSMSELSGYLRNIFTVFNEVRCNITDLRVVRKSEGVYKTTYNMAITGRIFDQNIKHEEKSSVEEEVTLNERGKPVISKTMKGNFWYFE